MADLARGLFVAVAVLIPAGASLAQTEKPNIVWIIGDDWGVHASSYGTAGVNTPNIDRVADEGVRFSNTFVTAPVCSAMRSALITGMYQTSIGAHHHRTRTKSALPAGVTTMSQYFRDEGYFVANGNSGLNGAGKTDYNFTTSGNYDGNDWRDRPDSNQPFFQQVQIYSPHRDFRGENTDANRVNELEVPAYYPDHELTRKDHADYLADVENFDDGVGWVLDRLEDDGLLDNTIVMVFGDHGAPHVRDKQWLYDGGIRVPLLIRDPTGTLVQQDEVGAVDDRMISHIDITATSIELAGADVPDFMQGVSFLDDEYEGREAIFAAKDRLDGVVDRVRSVQVGAMKLIRNLDPGTPYMLGDLKESAYKRRQYPVHTLMKVMNGRGLLTPGQAKFLTESRPEYELYDLSADPNEFNNLADDPAYARVLQDLSGRIDQWMVDTGDMGGDFDPDAVSEYNAMRDTYLDNVGDRLAPDGNDQFYSPNDFTDYELLEWWANEYDVDLDLAQSKPDPTDVRLPNPDWEHENAGGNGQWLTGTPLGWSDASGAVVQDHTTTQMAQSANSGWNALILNSGGGEVRWAMDDNWGNLVEFQEALGWEITLEVWVGRRSDSQGNAPGVLEVALENAAGETAIAETFDLTPVAQGTFALQTFTLLVTADAIEAAGGAEQLYLSLANIVEGLSSSNEGRVLIDDLSLSVSATLLGDFNNDGVVDAADFTVWRDNLGATGLAPFTGGDADGDGKVTRDDYDLWKEHFGETAEVESATTTAAPEPQAALTASLLVATGAVYGRPRPRGT